MVAHGKWNVMRQILLADLAIDDEVGSRHRGGCHRFRVSRPGFLCRATPTAIGVRCDTTNPKEISMLILITSFQKAFEVSLRDADWHPSQVVELVQGLRTKSRITTETEGETADGGETNQIVGALK